ncbi:methylmalonyl Co-A mutase-associated GTPase MeaB [Paracoccus denitrificans]|jgi:LAO/AO transport system kinase|nr:methylmalonyl Co-A mutase-associated GTPase MeaB [Paracoccus denitrificans]MCU7431192.1 methylmalonyl Co-A mutase-associated GTPase MeaB [Paracoccus denitrificans]QAR25855.1 methylmalonyl Co-A mutase-associated GTPase MeaB [Paracoccus denitrificans]UFS65742.1 methylmalonyl Co-A mutase-associated GTPase MeaB [Paracoccus denitrificans]UPV94760.1 methylmalonyl Co-A mutase-associated GTPase MeaB [Paracoccus denitrificans]WQO33191.1 methylmalonyl Co-A mutase-associated GTPase MeaB [Paracoccus de
MGMDELTEPLTQGNRRALSRAITLIESTRPDHRARALALLAELPQRQALRIGLSGTPGVGKSTFIEAFGKMLTAQGLKVAVLAVDPSSARSGGSILGDKTRMETLSRDPNAFIRPSPSRAELGGVARRTRETVRLCEAAGFDVVLIETVGVGQSETLVAEMSDLFILLLAPAGGDELQGVKRGIMEIADIILVNKADGDLRETAMRTVADYAGALRLLRKRPYDPEGFPKALPVSAYTGEGLDKAWSNMTWLADWRREHGHFDGRRAEQARHWFLAELRAGLLARLDRPEVRARLREMGDAVARGESDPDSAAAHMLDWLGAAECDSLTAGRQAHERRA